MDELGGNGDFLQNLVLGTIWSGVGALAETAKFGYGYVTDPQNRENTAQNAKQFAQNFGKYTPNGREWFFSDPVLPASKYQQKNQFQQLQDNRYLRSQGVQTGFDDEADNTIDDRARAKLESQQRANMATPNSNATNANQRTNIYSNKSSDYAPTEKLQSDYAGYQIRSLTDLQNYQMQSSDRRYATDRNADVNYQLGTQKNNVDYAVGMDRNAVTRDVGKYTSDNQLRASNYKSLADLQAALDKNRLQSGDNRYATDTQASTERFKWTTVNPTAIAEEATRANATTQEALIKAGMYGLSQEDARAMAKGRYQMEVTKFNTDIAQSQRAYSDQRLDRENDRSAAMAKFNSEMSQKIADRNRYYDDLTQQRQLQRDDFNLRSRQIQNQIDIANKDYLIRYGDAKLRQDQFAATRADISYNRGNQSSSLAFQWIELAKNY